MTTQSAGKRTFNLYVLKCSSFSYYINKHGGSICRIVVIMYVRSQLLNLVLIPHVTCPSSVGKYIDLYPIYLQVLPFKVLIKMGANVPGTRKMTSVT